MSARYEVLNQEDDWLKLDCKTCAWNDWRWTDKNQNKSAKFRMKVQNLWIGICHLINFVILLSIGLTYGLFNVNQTLVDSSLIPIGTVPIGIFILVCIGITAIYEMSYERLYFKSALVYEYMIDRHNPYRWIQYAFNNSLLLFSIGVVAKVRDINFLIIFMLINICSNLFFNMWEKHGGMESYALGVCIAIIPWIFVIRQSILGNVNSYSSAALSFGIINQIGICILVIPRGSPQFYDLKFIIWELLMKTIISWLIFGYLFI
jgi:hypothetical protein